MIPLLYYGTISFIILLWPVVYLPPVWSGPELFLVLVQQLAIMGVLVLGDLIFNRSRIVHLFRGVAFIFLLFIGFNVIILTITSITFYESMIIFALGGDFILTMIEAGFPPVLLFMLPVILGAIIALGAFIARLTPMTSPGKTAKISLSAVSVLFILIAAIEQPVTRDSALYLTRRKYPAYFNMFSTNSRTVTVPLPKMSRHAPPVLEITPGQKKYSIVFIVLESFRHDVVSPHAAPNLYAFNRESLHFTNAFGDGIYTSLSWNALLLNRPAWTIDMDIRSWNTSTPGSLYLKVLKNAGYRTAIVSSANMNWNRFLSRIKGKENLVDHFYSPYNDHRELPRNRLDTLTVKKAQEFHAAYRGIPHILIMQLDSTHWTYFPDRKLSLDKPYVESINMFKLVSASAIPPVYNRYLNSVRTVDDRIGKLFKFMKQSGTWDNSIVCVVSDHGEGFSKGRIGHSVLHDDIRRIYLSIKLPGEKHREVQETIQQRDIFPLIFSSLGITGSWEKHALGTTALNGQPRLVFHGSVRMADLIYPDRSVRLITRIRNDRLYATPVYSYNGTDLKNIKIIEKNYDSFIKDIRQASGLQWR